MSAVAGGSAVGVVLAVLVVGPATAVVVGNQVLGWRETHSHFSTDLASNPRQPDLGG